MSWPLLILLWVAVAVVLSVPTGLLLRRASRDLARPDLPRPQPRESRRPAA